MDDTERIMRIDKLSALLRIPRPESWTISVMPWDDNRPVWVQREIGLQFWVAQQYVSLGLSVRLEVPCSVGIADIVVEDKVVVEVKQKAGRAEFFQAVGQVLLYAKALGGLKPVIVMTVREGIDLVDPAAEAEALGINVRIVNVNGRLSWLRYHPDEE